jgi:hypothetical protein
MLSKLSQEFAGPLSSLHTRLVLIVPTRPMMVVKRILRLSHGVRPNSRIGEALDRFVRVGLEKALKLPLGLSAAVPKSDLSGDAMSGIPPSQARLT